MSTHDKIQRNSNVLQIATELIEGGTHKTVWFIVKLAPGVVKHRLVKEGDLYRTGLVIRRENVVRQAVCENNVLSVSTSDGEIILDLATGVFNLKTVCDADTKGSSFLEGPSLHGMYRGRVQYARIEGNRLKAVLPVRGDPDVKTVMEFEFSTTHETMLQIQFMIADEECLMIGYLWGYQSGYVNFNLSGEIVACGGPVVWKMGTPRKVHLDVGNRESRHKAVMAEIFGIAC